jgi:hypothetical protein
MHHIKKITLHLYNYLFMEIIKYTVILRYESAKSEKARTVPRYCKGEA